MYVLTRTFFARFLLWVVRKRALTNSSPCILLALCLYSSINLKLYILYITFRPYLCFQKSFMLTKTSLLPAASAMCVYVLVVTLVANISETMHSSPNFQESLSYLCDQSMGLGACTQNVFGQFYANISNLTDGGSSVANGLFVFAFNNCCLQKDGYREVPPPEDRRLRR